MKPTGRLLRRLLASLAVASAAIFLSASVTSCACCSSSDSSDSLPEVTEDEPVPDNLRRLLHATIKKVTEDTDTLNFNTAISQMMIFLNDFSKLEKMPREAAETYVLLLAPYAPHIAEDMWEGLGKEAPVSLAKWPEVDESHLQVDQHEILVQVCGKPKARIMMPASLSADEMEKTALGDPAVAAALAGKTVVKVIAVPGRLVNIVAR